MKKLLVVLLALAVVGGVAAFVPVGGDDGTEVGETRAGPAMDLAGFSDEPPGVPLRLLFVHHSVGGALLADRGEVSGELASTTTIWDAHPDGGGLRRLLDQAGYTVHEASYGSRLGESTDLFHWLPKVRDHMDDLVRTDLQDRPHEDGGTNQIVVLKSCFPNSDFVGEGEEPGNPDGPELTYWNARATLSALLEHFAARPDVLFVYVTAPPLTAPHDQPFWRWAAKALLGRQVGAAEQRRRAAIARRFNNWVRAPDGWLADYSSRNVVVFDYYDVLTGYGASNLSRYPTRGGVDPHPNAGGNAMAAADFVPLLNRAVRRAGLVPAPVEEAEAAAEPPAPGEAPELAEPDAEAPAQADAPEEAEPEEG